MSDVDVIYSPEVLDAELADWARALLPATVAERTLCVQAGASGERPTVPGVVLSTRPSGRRATGSGWEDLAALTLTVTCVGATRAQAKAIGGLLRSLIVGRERRGDYTTAMPLPSAKVLDRHAHDDGYLDVVSGIPQWSESYRLSYTRAPGA